MVSVNVTLFENRIFADVVKMRSAWIRLCTKSNDWYGYKRKRERSAYRFKETEIKMMCLQIKDL